MKIEDKAKFASLLEGVFDLHGKNLSQAVMEIWWRAMQPYDFEAVDEALNRHCVNPDNGQWLPKPADVVKLIDGGTMDGALLAWSKVERAIRSVGPWESVTFDDPVINAVIYDMGGWIRLNEATDDDWPFKEKEFLARYRAYRTGGGFDPNPEKLIGLADAQNRQSGLEDRPVTLIGNKQTGRPSQLKKPEDGNSH